jgi:hypothetical protein
VSRSADGRLALLFRDHALSDRLGFVYQSWQGADAVRDLLARLPGDGRAFIALDGENPWEAFPDAGEAFLRELFTRVPTRTCAEAAEDAPRGTVRVIHTGSWINADFGIWIGHEEDRRGWALLRAAREAWVAAGRPEAARPHLLAAEGSDWFWWFGDDFETPFAAEFDRLFRAHLAAAWRAMGREPPAALESPVKRRPLPGVRPPLGRLPPDDGTWFAWAPAGRVDLRAGAMAPARGAPHALLFGRRDGQRVVRALGASSGWSVTSGALRAPLHGWVELGAGDGPVVLEGPSGARLPASGALALPWDGSTPATTGAIARA